LAAAEKRWLRERKRASVAMLVTRVIPSRVARFESVLRGWVAGRPDRPGTAKFTGSYWWRGYEK